MATARRVLLAVLLSLALPAALSQTEFKESTPWNVTAVLEKAGLYTKFMRLMKSTDQDTKLNSELNGCECNEAAFTVLAPNDSAFDGLKPGTIESLSRQELVSLVRGHIIPSFFPTLESLGTARNPVRTMASGANGPSTVNVTAASNGEVKVSTGLVSTLVGKALSVVKPLAVYPVDKVLLQSDMFRPEEAYASAPPAPAAALASAAAGVVFGASRGSSLAAVFAACLL